MINSNLEVSFIETLKDSDLKELAANFSEIGLDKILEEGLFKDIPVISTFQKIFNVTKNISNYFFAKKLLKFLSGVSTIPFKERQKLIQQIDLDKNSAKKLGGTILLLLDRMDHMDKPQLMANAFKAFLQGRIDIDCFLKLSHAIDRIMIYYLPYLKNFYNSKKITPDAEQHLALCGLLNFNFPEGSINIRRIYAGFKKNELGALFVDVVLSAS